MCKNVIGIVIYTILEDRIQLFKLTLSDQSVKPSRRVSKMIFL